MMSRSDTRRRLSILVLLLVPVTRAAEPHNVILFVPDGMRAGIVDPSMAPTFARLRDEGVNFANSHSLFPTFTTANASAFATGHGLADTGDFSNIIYTGFPVVAANGSMTPFLESDPVLKEVNDHFGGNYLNEPSIAAAARAQGYSVALIGKLGPVAIFDVRALKGEGTLIVDDSTGTPGKEVPVPAEWKDVFARAKVSLTASSRGDNGNLGDARTPGTWIPDLAQEQYFLEVTVKAVLPHFKDAGKPFFLVFWSRDPDGSQHNQGDSLGTPDPGINGPTSLSAIRTADTALSSIEEALNVLGLSDSTDIIVAADHGFSTISKASATSASTKPGSPYAPNEVVPGELPPGFLAIDLFEALHAKHALQLFDPDRTNQELDWRKREHPLRGNAILGAAPDKPQIVVAANGGSDLVYISEDLQKRQARALARESVAALLGEDYVSGLFVDEARFGPVPGALSTELIGVGGGTAVTPHPAIVVNFASRLVPTCRRAPTLCAQEVADTVLQIGQGMHGSFSRADTWNFMAAIGPDFRSDYVDELPASNADIGMTIAALLHLDLSHHGHLLGRVLTEGLSGPSAAVPSAAEPSVVPRTIESRPARNGLKTVLKLQELGSSRYFDAAGFPGRTVGLE